MYITLPKFTSEHETISLCINLRLTERTVQAWQYLISVDNTKHLNLERITPYKVIYFQSHAFTVIIFCVIVVLLLAKNRISLN